MEEKFKYVIVGAGVSGLSTAFELAKAGDGSILIFDKEDDLGGLCRTIPVNNASYDLGSHRIHYQVPEHIMQFISSVSAGKVLKNARGGKLRLNKSYITYPIKSFQFFISLGFTEFFLCTFSFIKYRVKELFKKPDALDLNYETYLISHAGKRAYQIFYEPYARKVWGCEPSKIAVNAAKKRVSMSNPLSFIKEILSHLFKKTSQNFYYYLKNGIGDFSKGIEQKLIESKSTIVKGVNDFKLSNEDNKHLLAFSTHNGQLVQVEFETLVSTIPLEELVQKCSPGKEISEIAHRIKWRSIRLVYVHIKEDTHYPGESFYFPEIKYIFGRVSIPGRFSGIMQENNDSTCYVCEVACSEGDEKWNMSEEKMIERCYNDLITAGLISGKKESIAEKNFTVGLAKVYPMYTIGWQKDVSALINYLAEKHDYIYSSGKGGFFLHNNMDHSIEIGLQLARSILKGAKPAEWYEKIAEFHNLKLRD